MRDQVQKLVKLVQATEADATAAAREVERICEQYEIPPKDMGRGA